MTAATKIGRDGLAKLADVATAAQNGSISPEEANKQLAEFGLTTADLDRIGQKAVDMQQSCPDELKATLRNLSTAYTASRGREM